MENWQKMYTPTQTTIIELDKASSLGASTHQL